MAPVLCQSMRQTQKIAQQDRLILLDVELEQTVFGSIMANGGQVGVPLASQMTKGILFGNQAKRLSVPFDLRKSACPVVDISNVQDKQRRRVVGRDLADRFPDPNIADAHDGIHVRKGLIFFIALEYRSAKFEVVSHGAPQATVSTVDGRDSHFFEELVETGRPTAVKTYDVHPGERRWCGRVP